MPIEKSGRGRPSRQYILEQLDVAMEDLERIGGLPAPLDNAEIWRDIWYEEAHNSTAIEGNTLALKQVKVLLDENRPVGNKELHEYLEVKAYAQAARWVYERGRGDGRWSAGTQLIQLSEVRHVHRLAVGPVWELFSPAGLHSDEGAGSFRHHNIAPFSAGMAPPPFTDVHALMTDWLARVNDDVPGETHAMVAVAEAHAEFERIHPFRDGNGRVGRLVLNLMLVRQGFPPAVVRNRRRASYLTALRRADGGDPWPLTEIVARAVKESLDRFLVPSLAGPLELLPLSALTTSDLRLRALRAAADRWRLKATRDSSGRWLSTEAWVADYRRTRRVGRPRKATH